MDIIRVSLCGEFSRVAMVCRRRIAMFVISGFFWRIRVSFWFRVCCNARVTGRALEFCYRGFGFSGKIWSRV